MLPRSLGPFLDVGGVRRPMMMTSAPTVFFLPFSVSAPGGGLVWVGLSLLAESFEKDLEGTMARMASVWKNVSLPP